MQTTVPHALHKLRRTALDRYFSKQQIGYYAPEIQQRAEKLCNKFLQEYKPTGKVLSLDPAFACYATDVLTEYAFGREYGYMDYPDFVAPFVEVGHEILKIAHTLRLFPILRMILFNLPDRVVAVLQPGVTYWFAFQAVSLRQ